jgi:hypothetical protein
MVRDWDAALYRDNIMAHSELGKVFDLPVVMTSSAESGPNGPIPKEITDLYPNTTVIKRQGEVKYAYPQARWSILDGLTKCTVPGTTPNFATPL